MTTKRRHPRYLQTLLLCAGALLVVIAGVTAIIEGYAADAQMRGGNVIPAIVVAGLGFASASVGLVMPRISPRRADDTDEASENRSPS
ncbi:hypothetical protein GCM10010910_20030 [Microbacterium nanhaiense]|uniref:Uncharacterized protein n=1 Tax=Microbacterium nanhaiense TaxID=1301026 RepID=A0ABQ2N2U6_9MICO|nr:hypothetical protein [Microbacterium nanhaiense]GGO64650.1 hypothetical protein GCM10010910_20030 [Microbacterium nanhaiense]